MGMPMRKQISMVASRMKISMDCLSRSVEWRNFGGVRPRIGRGPKENPLDNEEQQANPADRNRQIGDADRQERKIRDGVVPGHVDQSAAPPVHEYCAQRHSELGS